MWYQAVRQVLSDSRDPKSYDGYGACEIQSIPVFVEYPKGSVRTKKDKEGKTWSRKMKADYGRITKSEGNDGDCIDVFIGDDRNSDKVFIIDQVDAEGEFDEHKCVMGCGTQAEARALYLANYPKDWKMGDITAMEIPEFKSWLKKSDKSVPAA